MDKKIAAALRKVERKQADLDDAMNAMDDALTLWLKTNLTELAKRFPKRRFEAWSGNGELTVMITPGPWHPLEHHRPLQRYTWNWNGMHGGDDRWRFIWGPWEEMCDAIALATNRNYLNLSGDFVVTGEAYAGD